MSFLSKLIKHELITGSMYLFIGTMMANVLAFILNLYLARNLTYADYGIFASLLSVVTLAFIPAGSISTIIVKFAAKFYSKGELNKVSAFYIYSFKIVLVFASILFVIFLTLSLPLNIFLHLNNIWYGVVVALIVFIYYLHTLNIAFLQSVMRFGTISLINIFAGIIKLIFGILLVIVGFKAFSGLWSIFFMTLGSFLIAFIPLRKIITLKSVEVVKIPTSEIFKYSVPAFFTVLFLTSFTTIDVILVKHFFNASDAGFYAGLSLIGKVIFYFTAPIPLVMFPLLIKRHAIGQAYKKLFYLALGLVLIPSFGITLVYFILPEFIIHLFLGGRNYLVLANYLGWFGVYLTIFSVANVFVNFFLSFNELRVSYFVILSAIIQIGLISLFHSTFYEVIFISIAVALLLLIMLITYYYKKYKF